MEGPLENITRNEVQNAMRKLNSWKAAGSSEATSEMFTTAGNIGTDIFMEVFRNSVQSDAAPEKWARSITVPLYKSECDALDCGKYRGLRLLEHGMILWEKF